MDKDVVFALISISSHLAVMCAVGWHLLKQMRKEHVDDDFDAPDEGGGGGPRRPDPRHPEPLGGGGLPLPDAVQSATRLRDGARLGDLRRPPARRRPPEPRPARTPSRS